MCGITWVLEVDGFHEERITRVRHRGPDAYHTLSDSIPGIAIGSVLHIQGNIASEQPMNWCSEIVFLWNGEVFGGLTIPSGSSDTATLFELIKDIYLSSDDAIACQKAITLLFSAICGPFAFILYLKKFNRILFGRDPFGRRSLLLVYQRNDPSKLVGITSVSWNPAESWIYEEVDIEGVKSIVCGESQVAGTEPWPQHRLRLSRPSNTFSCAGISSDTPSAAPALLAHLQRAVERRVRVLCQSQWSTGYSTVGVLFSGGLDSVVLTALLHLCMEHHPDSPIDLINVSFAAPPTSSASALPSPDRIAAIVAYGELRRMYPHRRFRLVEVDVPLEEQSHAAKEYVLPLIQPSNTHMDLNIGTAFWFASRGRGVVKEYSSEVIDKYFKNIRDASGRPLLRVGEEDAARAVGVSTWKASPNGTEAVVAAKTQCVDEKCRRIAKPNCAFQMCRRCCLKRQKELRDVVCSVHKRGEEQETTPEDVSTESNMEPGVSYESLGVVVDGEYRSRAKALLIGIGADEQMAGYGRHRTVFVKGEGHGQQPLTQELNKDLDRLWKRNLGRDDRCVSDHGREAWFPYLDEEVVSFLHSCPIEQICDLTLPPGEGDKKILRDVAKILGFVDTASFVKRAIQFGTRIAKITNVQFHGSNRKGSGQNLISHDE